MHGTWPWYCFLVCRVPMHSYISWIVNLYSTRIKGKVEDMEEKEEGNVRKREIHQLAGAQKILGMLTLNSTTRCKRFVLRRNGIRSCNP